MDKWDYLKNLLLELESLFIYGSYESLERLEGKTKEGPFFKVQSNRITVCDLNLWIIPTEKNS